MAMADLVEDQWFLDPSLRQPFHSSLSPLLDQAWPPIEDVPFQSPSTQGDFVISAKPGIPVEITLRIVCETRVPETQAPETQVTETQVSEPGVTEIEITETEVTETQVTTDDWPGVERRRKRLA